MKPTRNSIGLKGLERLATYAQTEGTCEELLNLRPREGAWKPTTAKVMVNNLSDFGPAGSYVTKFFEHHPAAGEHAFVIYAHDMNVPLDQPAANRLLFVTDHGQTNPGQLPGIDQEFDIGPVQTIAVFHNIVVASTMEDVHYFLYRAEKPQGQRYIELPALSLPQFSFEKEVINVGAKSYLNISNPLQSNKTLSSALGTYLKQVEEKEGQNFFTGHALFCIAYRLKDDSLMLPSNPVYVPLSFTGEEGASGPVLAMGGNNEYYWFTGNYASRVHFKHMITPQMKIGLEQWRDIIDSLQIFCYRLPSHYSYTDAIVDYKSFATNVGAGWELFSPKEQLLNGGIADFFDNPSFFFAQEISFSDIMDYDAFSWKTQVVNIKEVEAKRSITINDFTNHRVWGDSYYTMNNRLHLCRINTRLSQGPDLALKIIDGAHEHSPLQDYKRLFKWQYPGMFMGGQIGEFLDISPYGSFELYFVYHIRTDQSTICEIKKSEYFTKFYVAASPGETYFVPQMVITYPDARCFKAEMVIKVDGAFKKLSEYNMKEHPFHSYAYHVEKNETFLTMCLASVKPVGASTGTAYTMPETGVVVRETNRMQVSEIENPLIYPSAISYRFDDNYVRAVAAATETQSQGQFGDFPVYVFTSQGIYAMLQGQGLVVYARQVFARRDTIVSDHVLPVPGAVAYIAQDGLKLITGNQQVLNISKSIERHPDQLLSQTARDFIQSRGFTAITANFLSQVSFLDYLKEDGTIMLWDSENGEIVVSNHLQAYSYGYTLGQQLWRKITASWQFRIMKDNWCGVKTSRVYRMDQEQTSAFDFSQVFFVTAPIKIDGMVPKKLMKAMFRANLYVQSAARVGFYVMGSNDLASWTVCTGTEKESQDKTAVFGDLTARHLAKSYKYLSFVFVGTLTRNAELFLIDTQHQARYVNRLR